MAGIFALILETDNRDNSTQPLAGLPVMFQHLPLLIDRPSWSLVGGVTRDEVQVVGHQVR